MYLHVGNHHNIRLRDVIGIFDADSATVSAVTKKYLSAAQGQHTVHFTTVDVPKSFVLYRDRVGKPHVCFSQLSTAALVGRVEGGYSGKE